MLSCGCLSCADEPCVAARRRFRPPTRPQRCGLASKNTTHEAGNSIHPCHSTLLGTCAAVSAVHSRECLLDGACGAVALRLAELWPARRRRLAAQRKQVLRDNVNLLFNGS